MMTRVGLLGYGRAGKDEAYNGLRPLGYKRHPYGDVIKRCASVAPISELWQVHSWLRKHEPEIHLETRHEITEGYLLIRSRRIDPFTQDDAKKPRIRAFLERYGAAFYDRLQADYWASMPDLACSTRILRLEEASDWVSHGGHLIEIVRPGIGPDTPFSERFIRELSEFELPRLTVRNDGGVDDLHARIREAVQ